ncbi:MAG TPA: hypothetical protein VD707_01320 [Gemmatimonadales bacterium]|nr:hypothetical protein [Gemmatimonadales bacterium]
MTFVAKSLSLGVALLSLAGCASSRSSADTDVTPEEPSVDPRVGLRAGLMDAAEATWNLEVVSRTPPEDPFSRNMNSDLAFTGHYAIQGNFNGFQVWDIEDPEKPVLVKAYVCPASQSDVSVYKHLLFVSAEDLAARLDCGTQGVHDTVSTDRIRGIRIFDISDIAEPKYVANVQTCRGSHTHTVVEDANDPEHVYVYISGSGPVRSPNELAGCSRLRPYEDPNSALFRIEVIKVPVAHPEQAAIVTSPRIFEGLRAPVAHGEAPQDVAAAAEAAATARAAGAFTVAIQGMEYVLPPQFVAPMLADIVRARGDSGAPTAADSAALREALPGIMARMMGDDEGDTMPDGTRAGPSQCHDITVYPAIGLAGGACGGYGLLLDIRDPANPKRIDAVADSNFAYWHSATFNNDGSRILFSDEWGGGGGPKCRATDRPEWGADAIFSVADNRMTFGSYYKLPAPQTAAENCVAHNGSLIPVPGRDIMAQAWYQGGVSVFEWTDPAHPREIAFFDRGPVDSTQIGMAGSWSAYWYNGYIYSSEIGRGLDVLELMPSALLSQNEIDAAKSVELEYLNVQGQPRFVWPASFALPRAYLDQLARSGGYAPERIFAARNSLVLAEGQGGAARQETLKRLAERLTAEAAAAADPAKVRMVATAVTELATGEP